MRYTPRTCWIIIPEIGSACYHAYIFRYWKTFAWLNYLRTFSTRASLHSVSRLYYYRKPFSIVNYASKTDFTAWLKSLWVAICMACETSEDKQQLQALSLSLPNVSCLFLTPHNKFSIRELGDFWWSLLWIYLLIWFNANGFNNCLKLNKNV